MNKREYDKKNKDLGIEGARIYTERLALQIEWKVACKHPVKYLSSKENWYEDEYGKTMESWTDYDYYCSRCDTTVRKSKIAKDIVDIQSKLTEEALDLAKRPA